LLTNGFLLLKMAYFTFCPPFCEFFTEMSSFFSSWIWQPYLKLCLEKHPICMHFSVEI
jgi:hypothetical protein